MTDAQDTPKKTVKKAHQQGVDQDRKARLAASLKDNIARRKAQFAGRKSDEDTTYDSK